MFDKLKQEFKKFCGNLSMEQVNAAFKAFDLSGDNQLDYDEFCKLMNNRCQSNQVSKLFFSRDKKKKAKREEERKKKEEEKRKKHQERRRRRSSLDEDDAKEARKELYNM